MGSDTDLLARRSEYAAALDRAVDDAVERLREDPAVRKVILFGSMARGRRDLCTDLDLVVVLESDREFVPRCAELRRRMGPGVDADLLAYTPEEFERLSRRGFLRRAVTEGKVLYER